MLKVFWKQWPINDYWEKVSQFYNKMVLSTEEKYDHDFLNKTPYFDIFWYHGSGRTIAEDWWFGSIETMCDLSKVGLHVVIC